MQEYANKTVERFVVEVVESFEQQCKTEAHVGGISATIETRILTLSGLELKK